MTGLLCNDPNCSKPAGVHTVRVEQTKCVEERHLCTDHGRKLVWQYHLERRVGAGAPYRSDHGVSVDVAWSYYDDMLDPQNGNCAVYLREVGGWGQIGFKTGISEWHALTLALTHPETARPLTHPAMAETVTALGGRLECVVLDTFIEEQSVYEAKLLIEQDGRMVVVDVRPSDAVVLAVVCDVRILVSHVVLSTAVQPPDWEQPE